MNCTTSDAAMDDSAVICIEHPEVESEVEQAERPQKPEADDWVCVPRPEEQEWQKLEADERERLHQEKRMERQQELKVEVREWPHLEKRRERQQELEAAEKESESLKEQRSHPSTFRRQVSKRLERQKPVLTPEEEQTSTPPPPQPLDAIPDSYRPAPSEEWDGQHLPHIYIWPRLPVLTPKEEQMRSPSTPSPPPPPPPPQPLDAIPDPDKCATQIVQSLSETREAGFVQGDLTPLTAIVSQRDETKTTDIDRRGCPIGCEQPEISDPEPDPEILLQPETRPISPKQLIEEVKDIYAGLVMVEAKCIDVDQKQSLAAQEGDLSGHTKLSHEQWQALIALHKTLLHEHHDFFLASQHPSAHPALRRFAAQYPMPAQMWRHGIHAFLEELRHRLPESLDHMLAFNCIAYSMVALLYEAVPTFEDTCIECLGDLGQYRMAIEDDNIRDREVWDELARFWYSNAAHGLPEKLDTSESQRPYRRGRSRHRKEAFWRASDKSNDRDHFKDRECLFEDKDGRLTMQALAHLDTGLRVRGGLIMSSRYAEDIGVYLDMSKDFEDPCMQSISGHHIPITGLLRNVKFRLEGTPITFVRDFYVCDAIDDVADIMFGDSFIKKNNLLFEDDKRYRCATWFSTKKENKKEKQEREQREREQDIKGNEREIARLQKEKEQLEAQQRRSQLERASDCL